MTLGMKETLMTLPNNIKTKQLARDSRLIIGRNVYKITSFDNYSSTDSGLLRISLLEDKKIGLDDMESKIANNEYRKEIDESDLDNEMMSGSSNVVIGFSEIYKAKEDGVFIFSVDSLSTPNSAFDFNQIDDRTASVKCLKYMDENFNKYQILLKIKNVNTNEESEKILTFKSLQ